MHNARCRRARGEDAPVTVEKVLELVRANTDRADLDPRNRA